MPIWMAATNSSRSSQISDDEFPLFSFFFCNFMCIDLRTNQQISTIWCTSDKSENIWKIGSAPGNLRDQKNLKADLNTVRTTSEVHPGKRKNREHLKIGNTSGKLNKSESLEGQFRHKSEQYEKTQSNWNIGKLKKQKESERTEMNQLESEWLNVDTNEST